MVLYRGGRNCQRMAEIAKMMTGQGSVTTGRPWLTPSFIPPAKLLTVPNPTFSKVSLPWSLRFPDLETTIIFLSFGNSSSRIGRSPRGINVAHPIWFSFHSVCWRMFKGNHYAGSSFAASETVISVGWVFTFTRRWLVSCITQYPVITTTATIKIQTQVRIRWFP